MVIVQLTRKPLSGFLPEFNFFLWLSVLLSNFHGFLNKLYDFTGYRVYFETVCYPSLRGHTVSLFVVNQSHRYIFSSRFVLGEDVLTNNLKLFCSSGSLGASFLFLWELSAAY